MEKRTVRAVYDNGEIRLIAPVALTGCWNVEITFVDQIADETTPFEADPHRPEHGPPPDRMEEFHRHVTDHPTHLGPF